MDSRWISKRVGGLIKSRRKHLGITQENLAAQMGMSRAALANVETGRQNILVHHLYRFAERLDLDVTDLLPDPAEYENSATPNEFPLPENLSREQRAQIARALRGDGAPADTTKDEQHGTRKKTQS
jgi:transcriptional regulator with XRE-family HTH domain